MYPCFVGVDVGYTTLEGSSNIVIVSKSSGLGLGARQNRLEASLRFSIVFVEVPNALTVSRYVVRPADNDNKP